MSERKTRSPGRIKSSIARWLGIPIELTNGEFWAAWNGGRMADSGEVVTVDAALQLSAFWACVRLLAETIATLPLGLYDRAPDGSRRLLRDHAVHQLLHGQPNADMSAMQFLELLVASMLIRGNAFAEKRVNGAGRLVGLDFLLPSRIQCERRPDGSLRWRYQDLDGREREIPEDRLWHIPAFGLDGQLGLSPIAYGTRIVGNALASDRASGQVFAKGLRASGFVTSSSMLKEAQREQVREKVKSFVGQNSQGGVMVLEGGMDFKQISMLPEDAQMLETRAFNVEEICRWFRVPPFMVGHSEKSTSWGTGLEQQLIGFMTFSLRPWVVRIEQSIKRSLLTPAERQTMFAEFNLEALLRADSAARAAFYSAMVQNGIYTRDDVREKENLPRVGGNAAVLTVQSNLLPIDELGSGADAAKAKDWLRNLIGAAAADPASQRENEGSYEA